MRRRRRDRGGADGQRARGPGAGGDPDAFTELVDATGGRLHAIAYSILRDRDAAADATQHALMAAWRGLPGLRDPERFEAWTYRLVVRACHAEARGRPAGCPSTRCSEQMRGRRPGSGPSRIGDRDQLERGFRRLSVEQRAVVVLRHLAGPAAGPRGRSRWACPWARSTRASRGRWRRCGPRWTPTTAHPTPPTPAVGGHVTVEVRR